MIQVTKGSENGIPKYPYVGISTASKAIVLFVKAGTGVVLVAPDSSNSFTDHDVGDYSEDWHEGSFTPYPHPITIRNG